MACNNVYGSNFNQLDGVLIITAYDADRKLISGSYTANATAVKDPFLYIGIGGQGSDPRRSGDMQLTGTFEEIPF